MMGSTHLTLGVAAGLAVGLALNATFPEATGMALIGGVAALLPDIDHPNGQIRQKMGVAGHLSLFWLSHRGLTHTLPFTLLVAVLSFALAPDLIQWPIVAGYTSHLVADSVTRRGIPLWWPLSNRPFHAFLPRPLRITTGGWVERIVWVFSLVGIALMLWRGEYAP